MAYLDENGIPRVAEGIQRYNDSIDEVAKHIAGIQQELACVFYGMPDDSWINDTEIQQRLQICNELLEELKRCCIPYQQVG